MIDRPAPSTWAACVLAAATPLLPATLQGWGLDWTASPWPAFAGWIVTLVLLQVAVAAVASKSRPRPSDRELRGTAWVTLLVMSFGVTWQTAVSIGIPAQPATAALVALVMIALGWRVGVSVPGSAKALVVALLVPIPWIAWGTTASPFVPSHMPTPRQVHTKMPMVVIVTDSFGSPAALAPDGLSADGLTNGLKQRGFRVWRDSRTNYSQTTMALPAILDGSYPVTGRFDRDDTARLHAGIGGGTDLLAGLIATGSRLEFHEASWSLSRCHRQVDVCARDSWWSELHGFFLRQTPIPYLAPARVIHPFQSSGLRVLRTVAPPEADVVAVYHATLPHEPFVLGADSSHAGGVTSIQAQIDCTALLLLDAVDQLDLSTTTVVIVADHGFDTRGQVRIPPDEWTSEMVIERFGAFLAISSPEGCERHLAEPVTVVNVLPWVLDCSPFFVPLEDRYFVSVASNAASGTVVELDWPDG